MPAILRIFLYQTDASLTVIGSAEPYGTIRVQGAHLRSIDGLQHYEVSDLALVLE